MTSRQPGTTAPGTTGEVETPDAGPRAAPGRPWTQVLPLTLLIVLGLAGLRGAVTAPRWNGPLRHDGVAIGLALEVILGVLLAAATCASAASPCWWWMCSTPIRPSGPAAPTGWPGGSGGWNRRPPPVHKGVANLALILAICGVAGGALRLLLAGVPVPEDSFLLPAPLQAWLRFLDTVRRVPWEEGAVLAIVWLEALHRSRPWHTAVLGAALIAYLLATHLAESDASPRVLRPAALVLPYVAPHE
jgi:hypothetical protein